jgi:hypothetical protein
MQQENDKRNININVAVANNMTNANITYLIPVIQLVKLNFFKTV